MNRFLSLAALVASLVLASGEVSAQRLSVNPYQGIGFATPASPDLCKVATSGVDADARDTARNIAEAPGSPSELEIDNCHLHAVDASFSVSSASSLSCHPDHEPPLGNCGRPLAQWCGGCSSRCPVVATTYEVSAPSWSYTFPLDASGSHDLDLVATRTAKRLVGNCSCQPCPPPPPPPPRRIGEGGNGDPDDELVRLYIQGGPQSGPISYDPVSGEPVAWEPVGWDSSGEPVSWKPPAWQEPAFEDPNAESFEVDPWFGADPTYIVTSSNYVSEDGLVTLNDGTVYTSNWLESDTYNYHVNHVDPHGHEFAVSEEFVSEVLGLEWYDPLADGVMTEAPGTGVWDIDLDH